MSVFHLLSVPHTVAVPEYSTCAFTQKVLKLATMLRRRNHYVIHYGHEASQVDCDEHITVTTDADLRDSYGEHDWRKEGFPQGFKSTDRIYNVFSGVVNGELHRRSRPGEFLLCPFGVGHKPVADAHPELIAVESGIGYAETFARYRVFESYAMMHAAYGIERVAAPFDNGWYDAMIPNAIDMNEFAPLTEREISGSFATHDRGPYFLFLGRVYEGKGVHVASDIVKAVGGKLVVAGPGKAPEGDHIVSVGVVSPAARRFLLGSATAVICPSMFVEPFNGVHVEAMAMGTPVISTDWGAFTEYNIHGQTGYRCRTREQFIWALRNIDRIDRDACRYWATTNFNLERIADMYDEYFDMVSNCWNGGVGWPHENPDRTELNWLNRHYPTDRTREWCPLPGAHECQRRPHCDSYQECVAVKAGAAMSVTVDLSDADRKALAEHRSPLVTAPYDSNLSLILDPKGFLLDQHPHVDPAPEPKGGPANAYRDGYSAGLRLGTYAYGTPKCPYAVDTNDRDSWFRGFKNATDDAAK